VTPREQEKLLISTVGQLAKDRKARGEGEPRAERRDAWSARDDPGGPSVLPAVRLAQTPDVRTLLSGSWTWSLFFPATWRGMKERLEEGKPAGPGVERSVGASGARLPEETRQSSMPRSKLARAVMGSPVPGPAAVLMLPDSQSHQDHPDYQPSEDTGGNQAFQRHI
jgi:hypothetical protein